MEDGILPKEIRCKDIIKALMNEDGVEEEMLGTVTANTGTVLGVRFLRPSESFYKSAPVHVLEEEVTPVPYYALCEHYNRCSSFGDLEMKAVGEDMYVFHAEVDVEDDDSEIWHPEDSASDTDDSFIAPDDVTEFELPPGSVEIDREWDAWKPNTPGAQSFKDTIDRIENLVRHHYSSAP